MTWYGITDLRAALGIEQTNGPVLSALLAEGYTDVIILGFTNSDKSEVDVAQSVNAAELGAEASREFVDRFANTTAAHDHFKQWLQKRLREAENRVSVHMQAVTMKHLNDTERIYEVATKCLNAVASLKEEKMVTLFLSPGTPVMAFVWAFAALGQPSLKKRLIASSKPGKPPEVICLPSEWMEWHGRRVRSKDSTNDQYDVIFHLFGEQRLPSLLGINQFSCKQHIFVSSRDFDAKVMKQFIGNAEYGEITVDPYDPEEVRSTVLRHLESMPSHLNVGFNLTGGTKLMYAGALAACKKANATPFYFDGKNSQLVYLNDFKKADTKRITSVETFIKLNGNGLFISKSGVWDEIVGINEPSRQALTKHLWEQRSVIARLYGQLAEYTDHPGHDFRFSNKTISVALIKGRKAEIIIKKQGGKDSAYRFADWPDFARYLCGGWFEEYTYIKLKKLVDSGLIYDLRIGLEVSFNDSAPRTLNSSNVKPLKTAVRDTYQELDIVFTDGRRLYVLECKAGRFIQGVYVRKLESITRYFGGIGGRGILACCFNPGHAVIRQKAKESNNVELISGDSLFDELGALLYKNGGHE